MAAPTVARSGWYCFLSAQYALLCNIGAYKDLGGMGLYLAGPWGP